MAAEAGKVDPMHQFTIEPLFGSEGWQLAGYNIAFTNSSLWMALASLLMLVLFYNQIWTTMWISMRRVRKRVHTQKCQVC